MKTAIILFMMAASAFSAESRISKIVRVMNTSDKETSIKCVEILSKELKEEKERTADEIQRLKEEITLLKKDGFIASK